LYCWLPLNFARLNFVFKTFAGFFNAKKCGKLSDMLKESEIKHIAKLARIELNDETEKKLQKELSSILVYIDKLSEVNTDRVEPLYQVTGLVNQMRADEQLGNFPMDERLNERLVGQAPHKQERFIKVKSVLKHK